MICVIFMLSIVYALCAKIDHVVLVVFQSLNQVAGKSQTQYFLFVLAVLAVAFFFIWNSHSLIVKMLEWAPIRGLFILLALGLSATLLARSNRALASD